MGLLTVQSPQVGGQLPLQSILFDGTTEADGAQDTGP